MRPIVLESNCSDLLLVNRGKVRDIYDLGEHLLIVTSDRISAFDVIMNEGIPDKGFVLTQISKFWFERMTDIVPNHLVATEVNDFPEATHKYREQLEGRSMLVKKAAPLTIEPIGIALPAGDSLLLNMVQNYLGALEGIGLLDELAVHARRHEEPDVAHPKPEPDRCNLSRLSTLGLSLRHETAQCLAGAEPGPSHLVSCCTAGVVTHRSVSRSLSVATRQAPHQRRPGDTSDCAELFDDLVRGVGLRNEVLGALHLRPDTIRLLVLAGNEYHRDILGGRIVAQVAAGLETVHVRHDDVEKYEVRLLGFSPFQRLGAAGRRNRQTARAFDDVLDIGEIRYGIVANQHFGHGHFRSS